MQATGKNETGQAGQRLVKDRAPRTSSRPRFGTGQTAPRAAGLPLPRVAPRGQSAQPVARGLALLLALVGAWLVAGLVAVAAGQGAAPPSLSSGSAAELTPTPDLPAPQDVVDERPLLPRSRVQAAARAALPPLPGWLSAALRQGPGTRAAGGVTVGNAAPDEIDLGDELIYTLVVTNTSGQAATVLLYDVLPMPALDHDVDCDPTCGRDVEVITVTIVTPSRYGAPPYTELVTVTHRVRWAGLVLPHDSSATIEFSFPVAGLDDGATLENRAYIRYELADGQTGTGMSDEIETVVRVPVSPGDGLGLSSLPVWYSDDFGGTGSLDWGDFDRDGDLDLVLGGSSGTTVYRNNGGHLIRLWTSGLYTHDVHWIELDGSDTLELVSIGYDWWLDEIDNHVYRLGGSGDRFEEIEPTALAGARLLRVEPADLDRDGDVDLVAVTYARWTTDSCTFRLYDNDGTGFNEPYRCLVAPDADLPGSVTTEDLLSLADADNDDALDMVVDLYDLQNTDPTVPCTYRDMLWLLPNRGGAPTLTQLIPIDTFTRCNFPVRVAWGDYDRDGDLDLAAAVPALTSPNDDQIRLYRNRWIEDGALGFDPPQILSQPHDQPPYVVRWSDVDGDGLLDLVVGGAPYRVYLNRNGAFDEDRFVAPPHSLQSGQAHSLQSGKASDPGSAPVLRPAGRGSDPDAPAASSALVLDLAVADYDNDGDVDIVAGNPLAPSALYGIFASRLAPAIQSIASWGASSVAWGDANADGSQDLLFGASENSVDAELYLNVDGQFTDHYRFSASGFGPHSIAFGDVDGDGVLEIAMGTAAEIQLYEVDERDEPAWTSAPGLVANSLAWGDADADGDLDLAAGLDGRVVIFSNAGGSRGLSPTPTWSATLAGDARAIAWANVGDDYYLDLAVASHGQPTRLYHNNGDGTFSLVWDTYPRHDPTTSLAWADYDGDGDSDLALGNDGAANVIYENVGGALAADPVWASAELSQTTGLAWGDWDNDGDPDLAVGNRNEPNQVYLNRGSSPGRPRLLYLWRSSVGYPTTGIAWGDRDGDGDLDLAISGDTRVGIYTNYGILPSHLDHDFRRTAPLPKNQSYLAVRRPDTPDAFFYSAPGLLSGPEHPTVTIEYRAFDVDGTRTAPGSNAAGDPIAHTLFEYSLDGGGTWQAATPATGSPEPLTTTCRLGDEGRFVWNALADAAIGDDIRFRVSIAPRETAGGAQHGLTRAVSPPFRVRGTTCIWPTHPAINASDLTPAIEQEVTFQGSVAQASGILTFTWDFDDGTTDQGQVVRHRFSHNNRYTVRVTIVSEPCPVAKVLTATREIRVGTGAADIYLPVIAKGAPPPGQ